MRIVKNSGSRCDGTAVEAEHGCRAARSLAIMGVQPSQFVIVGWHRAYVPVGGIPFGEVVIDHRANRRKYDRQGESKD
tara:strand:- start:145 stop:378 length:234 start_codon:yes stop_codon:yes gene_type:complete